MVSLLAPACCCLVFQACIHAACNPASLCQGRQKFCIHHHLPSHEQRAEACAGLGTPGKEVSEGAEWVMSSIGANSISSPAGGHAGYEIAPFVPSLEAVIVGLLGLVNPSKDLSGALNTVQHHDMHHRFPTRHFSLYFTHWDRWCGTEHPAYSKQVQSSLFHGGSRLQMPIPACALESTARSPDGTERIGAFAAEEKGIAWEDGSLVEAFQQAGMCTTAS